MSVWSTKSLGRDRDYIVLQHTLKGVNYVINGVKFRDSYAVVERDSKTYYMLKRVPVLRGAKEFPITYLSSLRFITRQSDIKTIYGQDVYSVFLTRQSAKLEADKAEAEIKRLQEEDAILAQRQQEIEKKLEIQEQIKEAKESGNVEQVQTLQAELPEIKKCAFRYENGGLCKHDSLDYSPSDYCGHHLLEDPKLVDFDLVKPAYMSKEEKSKFREKVKNTLEKAKKQGKF